MSNSSTHVTPTKCEDNTSQIHMLGTSSSDRQAPSHLTAAAQELPHACCVYPSEIAVSSAGQKICTKTGVAPTP